MSIDVDTARRVANLARIRIPEDQLPRLAQELSGVLDWIEQLGEVDIEGVEPMTSVTPRNAPLRDDAVTEGAQADRIMANAPATREGFFAVPKVVE